MATVSCIIITTLIIVSLANLLLLVHIIMHECSVVDYFTKKPKTSFKKPYLDSIRYKKHSTIQKRLDPSLPNITLNAKTVKFMGALILHHHETVEYVCAVAAISKNWVLVPKNCWNSINTYPKEFIQVATGGSATTKTNFHNIDVEISGERMAAGTILSVFPFFKPKTVEPIALAAKNYKYLSNSSAVLFGWKRENGDDYVLRENTVKLLWYKLCELHFRGSYENGMVCTTQACYLSSDHQPVFLVQNAVLVGLGMYHAENAACDLQQPGIFYKISRLQDSLEVVQKSKKIALNIIFKL